MTASIKGLAPQMNHATDLQADAQLDALKSRAHGASKADEKFRKEIAKVSEDFETLFLDLVMRSMRKSVPKGGFVDGGNAEEIYRSMLDSEYTKLMASQRQTGIANSIQEFLLRSVDDGAKNTDRKHSLTETKSNIEAVKSAPDKAAGLKAYLPEGLLSGEKSETITSIPLRPQSVPPPVDVRLHSSLKENAGIENTIKK